nr:uncharacterized protein LOC117988092 [Maniola hyperantus]
MYERAARCASERGGAAWRRRCLAAAITCLRLAAPEHAFLAKPSSPRALQMIGPEELAAELRQEVPEAFDSVQQALFRTENIDFESLYPKLKEADAETLLAVTKRTISTSQFLPKWFLTRFMEVEGSLCVRALLSGGRALEAGELCCEALRKAALALCPPAPAPSAAPLALADLLLSELPHHAHHPHVQQVYNDLKSLVEEYMKIVIRTSEDMKLAQIKT